MSSSGPDQQLDPSPRRRPSAPDFRLSNPIFRERALGQLDVAVEIDNQLPLVRRRTWLVVLGVAIVAAAVLLWAALTPSQTSVSAAGRAVAAGGVVQLSPMSPGTVASEAPASGQKVALGETVFTVETMSGTVPVKAFVAGSIWQVLVRMGSGVDEGQVLATVLPEGSENTVLLAVPESASKGVVAGQQVIINGTPSGTVTSTSPPLPAKEVGASVGLPLSDSQLYVPVLVSLDTAITAGTEVEARIVLTSESVLERLAGLTSMR